MLGLKRRFFPTVLIAMRKNLLPCLSVSEPLSSVLNAWPKETKSGSMSWCWLCWRQFFFFQRLWISVFQCTRLGSSPPPSLERRMTLTFLFFKFGKPPPTKLWWIWRVLSFWSFYFLFHVKTLSQIFQLLWPVDENKFPSLFVSAHSLFILSNFFVFFGG